MKRIFKYSFAALALLLITAQVWHAFNFPIWCDDAIFGSVAKNLASGNGYAVIAFTEIFPFHPGITTGPIVILPATLLIKIFSNQHWVLGITITALTWILFLTIFFSLKNKIEPEKFWPSAFLTLLLLLLFSLNSENYGIYNSDQFSLWYLMLGEIPAIFLTLLGAIILFSGRTLLGSVILGLAIMSKTISGIACATILLINFIAHRKDFRKIFLSGLVFVAPFFLFELVKIISLGWNSYLAMQPLNGSFYKEIALAEDTQPSEKIHQLFRIFGFSFILLLALAGYLIKAADKKKNPLFYQLGIALLSAFILHSFWWVFFSIFVNYRYFAPALFYCIFGIFFLTCCTELRTKKFITLISLLILFRHESLDYLISHAYDKNKKLDEQLLITEKLTELQQNNVTLVSCGLNFELEYLLPKSRNFMDCQNLPKKLPNHQFILVNDFVFSDKILMKNNERSTVIAELPSNIKARCNEEFLTTETFSLSWCK